MRGLVAGLSATLLLLACSVTVFAQNAVNPPSQIHIAFAGGSESDTPNGMTISWNTRLPTNTSTVVLYTKANNDTTVFTGYAKQYFATFNHHVTVGPLKPSTRYYYRCGDSQGGFSPELSFVSAADETTTSFKVAVWGDLGTGSDGNAVDTFNFLLKSKGKTDFLWHVGDIGYANNDFLHDLMGFRYEEVYDKYMNDLQPLTQEFPYMVLPGNHEAECHSPICLLNSTLREKLQNFTAYNHRFKMPYKESKGTLNMWYSFNYANAHFINFDTETDFKDAPLHDFGDSKIIPAGHFAPEGAQVEWLENDLKIAAANRASGRRPWIFMGGHRPIYTKKGKIVPEQREAVEDLMNKYGVDIYFTGHVHMYIRTWPVFRDKVEQKNYDHPTNVVHLVVGGAGCDEYKAPQMSGTSSEEVHRNDSGDGEVRIRRTRGPLTTKKDADWIAAVNEVHYTTGIMEVHDNNRLTFRVYDSKTGNVVDQFELVKKH